MPEDFINYGDRPLIVSARLDDEAQSFFNQKRQEFFPPERNYLDAHLTLFHKLPEDKKAAICNDLKMLTNKTEIMKAEVNDIMFMGFGSAYVIDCPRLFHLRAALVTEWCDLLTPQDKQTFKPHVTFQNKVPAEQAKQVFAAQKDKFTPFSCKILGLSLWHYDNGPWELIEDFMFQG